MQMNELQEMFEAMLEPIMRRLEEVEKLAAEARDDDRKEETQMEEPMADVVEEIVEDVVEEVMDDEKEDEMGEGEYSKMSERIAELEKASILAEARVAELEAEISLRDAKAVVEADIASRPHLSQMSEKLVGLYQKDRDLYIDVLSCAGEAKTDVKSVLSQRVTSGFSEVQAPKDPFAAAHDVAAEKGITYREALEGILAK